MSINRMVASSQMPRADQRSGYRTIILAHMIRKKLGAEGLSASLCLGFGFEGLDLVTNALVGSAARSFGFGRHWLANVWQADEFFEAQFRGLQAFMADLIVFL
jgi:hypothetical protein